MKRIIIVVEGQTEQDFVHQCLAPYMYEKYGIASVSARLIGKPNHKGGNVKYNRLKSDVDLILKEPQVVVSTFIDFYRLENDFPNHDRCMSHSNANQRIDCLEESLANTVNSHLFIPYIQKHEFEALLFSQATGFQTYLTHSTCIELNKISSQFEDPEDINGENPPSYRLLKIFEKFESVKYNKRVYGNILALEIGLEPMFVRCQRFAKWVNQLGKLATHDE